MPNNPDIQKEIDRLTHLANQWVKHDLPRLVGKTAVDHFKENFDKEGFVDGGLQKWPDVKRRDSSSPWYGFDYIGEKRTSYAFKRDRKTGKTYKASKQKKLNFSKAATARKILNSSTNDLCRSITYNVSGGNVIITSDKPYAEVHNTGGTIKVFGKHPVKLPKRQFIGESHELTQKIDDIIDKGLDKIFNTE